MLADTVQPGHSDVHYGEKYVLVLCTCTSHGRLLLSDQVHRAQFSDLLQAIIDPDTARHTTLLLRHSYVPSPPHPLSP